MKYFPSAIWTVKAANTVFETAIAVKPGRSEFYLLTGGNDPYLVYLDGDHAGSGGPLAGVRDTMLVCEGIEFEVDIETNFRPAFVDQPIGALRLFNGGTSIMIKRPNGFDGEIMEVAFDFEDQSAHPEGGAGFKRWRIIKPYGDQRLQLIEFEATKTGSF